jgi:transposase
MRIIYERVAGLDVHKKTVVACRMRVTAEKRIEEETRTFGTPTAELLVLPDWLSEWDCTHVAMESTADYWKPVYNLLEGDFEVLLVNAQHVKKVPGRKTDATDAECRVDAARLIESQFHSGQATASVAGVDPLSQYAGAGTSPSGQPGGEVARKC